MTGPARLKTVSRTVGATTDPNLQDVLAHRLQRFSNLTDDQIAALVATLDPDVVEAVSDAVLAALVGGTLPTLPLHPAGGLPLGLPGAVQPSRYVGATVSGPPTTGTFAVGDFVIVRSGGISICTAAGSPGTWQTFGSGTFVSKGQQLVNVMDYGCTGNGVTDDTSGFESARAAAQTFGRSLFLPPGLTFKVSEIVPLWNGARVLAYGATLDIQTDHSATGRYLGLTNLEDVEVRGLRLKQSNGSGRNGVYGMVTINGGGDILLEDLIVNGGESTGIWTGTPGVATASGVSTLRIVRPKVLNTYADGIHISRGATDVQIDSPLVIGAGDDGIGLVAITTDDGTHNYNQIKRVTISNPIVRNLSPLGSGISIVGAKDVTVVGGITDTVHASGVQAAQVTGGNGVGTFAPSEIDISGHHVRNATGSAYLFQNTTRATITGGSGHGCAGDGVGIFNSTNCTATGVALTGNVGFGVYETSGSTGCHLLSCDLRGNTAGASHFDNTGNSADASCITA